LGHAIETRGLTEQFNSFTAVDHVDLSVEDGEIFGFLGPNGAGKTTTIRILCTLLAPSSGSTKVAGYDVVRQADKVRRKIGLVSEKLILYPRLTASENLTFFGALCGMQESVSLPRTRGNRERWMAC